MENRPDAGVLAENFVLNEIFEHSKVHFWRTTAKTEVDFIAEGKSLLPIEVKFQHFSRAKVNKSLYSFLEGYKADEAIMVTRDFWGEKAFKQSRIKFVPICYM
jgi:predicted AAA+ superfamily ATPase